MAARARAVKPAARVRRYRCNANDDPAGSTRTRLPVRLQHGVIVYHGTTIEHKESIEANGLLANSYVAASRDLAVEYATTRSLSRGSDGVVIYELDVPDAAVVAVQSWWWAQGQLLLPFGCPIDGIVSIEDLDLRPEEDEVET